MNNPILKEKAKLRNDIDRYSASFYGGELNQRYYPLRYVVNHFWNGSATENLMDVRRNGGHCHREELDDLPKVDGYLGPMYDGTSAAGVVRLRYETQEVYDMFFD